MIDAPTSTATFLLADAGDSVSSQENRSTWERDLSARHDQILRKAVEDGGGSVCGTPEGPFCAVFATVRQGVEAAICAGRGLSAERNGHAAGKVRMVLHAGVADERDGVPSDRRSTERRACSRRGAAGRCCSRTTPTGYCARP